MSETGGPTPEDLDLFTPPEAPDLGVKVSAHKLLKAEAAFLRLKEGQRNQVLQNTRIAEAEGDETKADIKDLVKAKSLIPVANEPNTYTDRTGQRHFYHHPETGRFTMVKDENGTRYTTGPADEKSNEASV